MKSKLFLKASSLVCALALLVTGIHTAFAADRNYTVEKQYTVTNASAVKAVELYKLRNSKAPGNMSLKEQGEDHLTMSATDNNNTLFGVITEVDGIDLMSSELKVDEWSYDITFAMPELNGNASFGYIYDWSKVGSTVAKQEDGTYTVTNGDTEFYCLGSDIQVNSDGYYFAQLGTFTQFGGQIFGNPITIAEDGTFTYGTSRNSTYNSSYGFYWKDTPTLKVSYVKSGENQHTYTVKAVNICTKNGTDYVAAEDKTIRTFTVDGSKAFDTGYVLFGASQYTKNGTDIVISNISVTYNKTLDYTAECEQFLNDNPIVETLYDGTFAPTKDTADTLKAQLNTALSQYKTFEEDEKTVFDNNFPNFESKVSDALKECARAAYGTVTTEKTVDAVAESVDVTTVYTARSKNLNGTGKYTANGSEINYQLTNNYNVTLGAITEINGVDLTSSDVSVRGWSYTMEFGQNDSPLGFLTSWKNFNTVISNDNGNYTVIPGNGTYYQIYGGQSIANTTDNGYLTGKGYQEGGLVEYAETISAADGVVTGVAENQNIWGKHFKDSDGTVLYWKGTPVITVSMTENADGETHTYTVTAKNLYYIDGTEYGDKVLVSNTSAVNPGYVLIGAGNYNCNDKADNTISFKDINVKYTIEEDITDQCVAVLEAGDGMIDRLDGIVTKANAGEVAADVAALKTAYEDASAEVKNAIDAKYADVAAKIAYAEKYAFVAANKASPELKGINIKKSTTVSASDLRFAVGYAADDNTDYTVAGYGAVVVLNQALEDKNAELTKDTAVKSGMENYFFDVYEKVTDIDVDNFGQFYVTITGSKGKPGTLIDCRPYVVYTDGADEFVLYASNDDADKNISNGQASKCVIFAARDLSNAMIKALGENAVYPDGYTKESYDAIISKIGNEPTTSAEKNVVFQFLYENCDNYINATQG